MKRFVLALATTFSVALAGCGTNPTSAQIGTGVGAAAGGAVGNVVTGGSTLGTIGGAAAGAIIGNEVGKRQDTRDRR